MTETTIGKPGTSSPGHEDAPDHAETSPAGYARSSGEDDRGYAAGDYAQHGLAQAPANKVRRDRAAIERQRQTPLEHERVEPADPTAADRSMPRINDADEQL